MYTYISMGTKWSRKCSFFFRWTACSFFSCFSWVVFLFVALMVGVLLAYQARARLQTFCCPWGGGSGLPGWCGYCVPLQLPQSLSGGEVGLGRRLALTASCMQRCSPLVAAGQAFPIGGSRCGGRVREMARRGPWRWLVGTLADFP